MQTITTIGLDIAKSVLQVHGVDAAGQVVSRRKSVGEGEAEMREWFAGLRVLRIVPGRPGT